MASKVVFKPVGWLVGIGPNEFPSSSLLSLSWRAERTFEFALWPTIKTTRYKCVFFLALFLCPVTRKNGAIIRQRCNKKRVRPFDTRSGTKKGKQKKTKMDFFAVLYIGCKREKKSIFGLPFVQCIMLLLTDRPTDTAGKYVRKYKKKHSFTLVMMRRSLRP